MPLPVVTILDAEFPIGESNLYNNIFAALGRANDSVVLAGLQNNDLVNSWELIQKSGEDGYLGIGEIINAVNNIEDSEVRNTVLEQLVGSNYQSLLGADGKIALNYDRTTDIGTVQKFSDALIENLVEEDGRAEVKAELYDSQYGEKKEAYIAYLKNETTRTGADKDSVIDGVLAEAIRADNYAALEVLLEAKYITTGDVGKVNQIISEGSPSLIKALIEGIKPEWLNDSQISTIIKRDLELFDSHSQFYPNRVKESLNGYLVENRYNQLSESNQIEIIKSHNVTAINTLVFNNHELVDRVADEAMAGGEFNAEIAKIAWDSRHEVTLGYEDSLSDEKRKELMVAAANANNADFMSFVLGTSHYDKEGLQAIYEHRDVLDDEGKAKILAKVINSDNWPSDIILDKEQIPAAFEEAVRLAATTSYSMHGVLEILMQQEGGNAGDNTVLTDEQIVASLVKEGREGVALEFARAFIAEGRLDMVAMMLAERHDEDFVALLGGLEVGEQGNLLEKISAAALDNKWRDENSELGASVSVSELYDSGVLTDKQMDEFQQASNVGTQFSNKKHGKFDLP